MSEPWKSEIGAMREGEYALRGQSIGSLMQTGDWLGTLALALIGRTLTESERPLLAACLIAAIDHGVDPPSAHVTKVVASCGKPVADSVAAGLLTLGPRHGNAASAAASWLQQQIVAKVSAQESVSQALASGIRLSGFGHAEYERDPRAVVLAKLAETHLAHSAHLQYALEVADELTAEKGKPLYLNIDGAIGAMIADLEWPLELADTIFLIARTVGLSAHAHEEMAHAKTYRREHKKT
jgi:citrate synthase